MLETIKKYFPGLTSSMWDGLAALHDLYSEWNSKINVISRKDMENFYVHHVLHSMAIMKVINFKSGTRIMDVGTGGGFPGIPLAICFPDCDFLLIDSIGKKIRVVEAVAGAMQLQNVHTKQARVEDISERFDFVVSRAVTSLPVFWKWTVGRVIPGGYNTIPNGILYLKGGDLTAELAGLKAIYHIYRLSEYFEENYLLTKKLVHLVNRSSKLIFDKEKKG